MKWGEALVYTSHRAHNCLNVAPVGNDLPWAGLPVVSGPVCHLEGKPQTNSKINKKKSLQRLKTLTMSCFFVVFVKFCVAFVYWCVT